MSTIETVISNYAGELLQLEGVVGIGEAEAGGAPCIRIYLLTDNPETRFLLPDQLDGIPVDIEIRGPLQTGL